MTLLDVLAANEGRTSGLKLRDGLEIRRRYKSKRLDHQARKSVVAFVAGAMNAPKIKLWGAMPEDRLWTS